MDLDIAPLTTKTAKPQLKFEKIGELVSIFMRNGVWCVNYQHNGQHRKSLKTRSKKDARLKALRLEREILTGNLPVSSKSATIEEAINRYFAAKKGELDPSTVEKYEFSFELLKELAQELGVTRLSKIDAGFMDKFRERRITKLQERPGHDGKNTTHKDVTTIKGLLKFAVKRGLVPRNPLVDYTLKKPKPKPQPYWTLEQLRSIEETLTRQPHRDVCLLKARTGMRIGEIKYLCWEDLDFKNRVIKIQPKPEWKPKTGDMRSVHMSDEVKELLERQPRPLKWVFTFPAIGPYQARQVSERRLLQYLQRNLKRLGLPGHLHTFRHTFISHALTNGVPEVTVRKWVGHVDAETIKRYTHIADSVSKRAMKELAETFKQKGGEQK